jgi:B-cell receptor-associated protein 31
MRRRLRTRTWSNFIYEIDNLRKELEQKGRDFEILKTQSEGLSREYNELSHKYAATQKQDSIPKKDK